MRWEQSGSGYANSVTWGYDDNNNLSTQKQTLNGTTYTTSYTYDKDNRLTKTTEGTVSAGYTYDALGRMTVMDAQSGGKSVVKTTIGYNDPSSTTATGQVRTWKSGATTYTYAYDARGNITSVSDGRSTMTYAYDSFDQLVRENNQAAGKTWTYAYDDGGNILSKTEYAYTTGTLGAAVRTVAYGYGDASWSDLLTSIGGQSLTADEIGNLLSDGTWTYTWQHGRQLAGMSKSGQTIAYGYDSDGKRITKTVNGTAYNYHYLGDQLVELTWSGNKLHFTYDSTGPLSVNCNGTEYFYVKNAQGDVTGLVSASGTRVVTYTYDAWGNPLSTTGSLATTLGAQNPLRYRGYVYDTETGLYYLQSRYYNPSWGRFINADEYLSTGQSFFGNNVFAYCYCSPVNLTDHTGKMAEAAACFGVFTAEEFAASLAVLGLSGPVVVWVIGIGAVLVIGAEVYAYIQTADDSSMRSKVLADVRAHNPEQQKVYQMAYINEKGALIRFGPYYDYFGALKILGCLAAYNNLRRAIEYDNSRYCDAHKEADKRGASHWGIYTHKQVHAKALAISIGIITPPEVHGSGMYGHYNDKKHSFHIWFGGMMNY